MCFLTLEGTSGAIECIVFANAYEKFAAVIKKGAVIIVDGRLSLREDKAPTVIASVISPCSKPDQGNNDAENDNNKQKRKGLFLRVSGANYEYRKKVENLLSIFDGSEPVYVYYNDRKKYSVMNKGVFPDKVLIGELKKILGDDNVVLQ